MSFEFPYAMLGDVRVFEATVALVGLSIYFVDFKYFKDQQEYHREAMFSRLFYRLYIYGTILSFVTLEILNWVLI